MNHNLNILCKNYLKHDERKYDWMGFRLIKSDPRKNLTYHHIFKAVYGEYEPSSKEYILKNGALLSTKSHELLHFLEQRNRGAYNKINKIFFELSSTINYPQPKDIVFVHRILTEAAKYDEAVKEKVLTYKKDCIHTRHAHYKRMIKHSK